MDPEDVACIKRLADDDERMKNAYGLLTQFFKAEAPERYAELWKGLFRSAWRARADFSAARKRRRRAADIAGQLADALKRRPAYLENFKKQEWSSLLN